MTIDDIKNIRIEDFDYPLPDERIARHPLAQRDACKLLVSRHIDETIHEHFSSLPSLLPENAVLVCNDTRVINARINFQKSTGASIEIFLLEPLSPEDYVMMFQARESVRWSCLIGNLKRWKEGKLEKKLIIDGREVTLHAERFESRAGNAHEVEFSWDNPDITFASIVDAAGYIPIPPYLKRASEASDTNDYQTIYAKFKGSVAAPTAGLHFTPELFDILKSNGISVHPVTLHVGAGTFQPVKSEDIGSHPMHTEVFSVSIDTVEGLINALELNRPIVAVGTTSVRTLESLPYIAEDIISGNPSLNVTQWEAYKNQTEPSKEETHSLLCAIRDYMKNQHLTSLTCSTSIMIAPGFKWRLVDYIITNFHQPQSTLLLLVSSFLGKDSEGMERWRKLYEEALRGDYRFLSYGDACLFSR